MVIWFLCGPMFAGLVNGIRAAAAWTGIATFILVVLLFAGVPASSLTAAEAEIFRVFSMSALLVAVLGVAFTYELSRRASEQALQDRNDELRDARHRADEANRAKSEFLAKMSSEPRSTRSSATPS